VHVNYSTWRKLPVGRTVVATGLLKISPDFLSKKNENPDKETNSNPQIPYHQNTFRGAMSVKPRSMDCSVGALKEIKIKIKKSRRGNLTPTPT